MMVVSGCAVYFMLRIMMAPDDENHEKYETHRRLARKQPKHLPDHMQQGMILSRPSVIIIYTALYTLQCSHFKVFLIIKLSALSQNLSLTLSVFQIKPVLPSEADKKACGRTDNGSSLSCRADWSSATSKFLSPTVLMHGGLLCVAFRLSVCEYTKSHQIIIHQKKILHNTKFSRDLNFANLQLQQFAST